MWSKVPKNEELNTEGGTTICDETHPDGARITLEKCGSTDRPYWAITMGIYGWFVHTAYFGGESLASDGYQKIKDEIHQILQHIKQLDENDLLKETGKYENCTELISSLVERYP